MTQKVYRYTPQTQSIPQGGVWALGNFDGVHQGHQALIKQGFAQAERLGTFFGVGTFEPHPRVLFSPEPLPPFRITNFRSKVQALADCGVGHITVFHFTRTFAKQSAEDFFKTIFVRDLKVKGLSVGHDFCFGYKRQGTPELLSAWGTQQGIDIAVLPETKDPLGERFSSRQIRSLLGQGQVDKAAEALNHPWHISGIVQKGKQQGRLLGFPTANVPLKDSVVPALGVYHVSVMWQDRVLNAVANVGLRPTVEHATLPVCEVHIPNFSGDLYGQHIKVLFHRFIRPERKFSSVEELKEQIGQDVRGII